MKFDRSTHDASIILNHELNTGRWGCSVITSTRTLRVGGFLPHGPDALQTAGLLTGIGVARSFNKRSDASRLQLLVSSANELFIYKLQNDPKHLVIPDHLRQKLMNVLDTNEVTFDLERSPLHIVLGNWIHNTVIDYSDEFPIAAVSQTLRRVSRAG
jgi:hypothetical protein